MRWLVPLLLLFGCQQRAAPPAPPPPAGTTAAQPWTKAQEACVDEALQKAGLDAYGSPQGTAYAGGTPLFDEATGQRTSRQEFLLRRRPDVLRPCGVGP